MPTIGRTTDRTSAGGSWVAGVTVASGFGAERAPPYDGGRPHRIAAITRNVAALIANANVTPPAATSRPPSAGPMTNPTLSRLAQALFAGPSCRSSPASAGMYAPIAG